MCVSVCFCMHVCMCAWTRAHKDVPVRAGCTHVCTFQCVCTCVHAWASATSGLAHKKPDCPGHHQRTCVFPAATWSDSSSEINSLLGASPPPCLKVAADVSCCLPVRPQSPADRAAQSELLTNRQRVGLWPGQAARVPAARPVATPFWSDTRLSCIPQVGKQRKACLFRPPCRYTV